MKKLSINELKCFRGENLVLNRISAEIKEGETFVIKGSNGSGKTTLLRVLSSLIKNYSGTIIEILKKIINFIKNSILLVRKMHSRKIFLYQKISNFGKLSMEKKLM